MVRKQKSSMSWPLILSLIAGGSMLAPGIARAQDEDNGTARDFRDEGGARQQDEAAPFGDMLEQNANQGVVRLARFSYVKGNVTWRADQGLEWSAATTNLPVRQDAQIWVTNGGRAELQFDDGSVLRLGNGALVTLKTLYSDEDGEFTQVTLNEGLATLRARHERGVYRIDAPLASITAKGPAKVRFGIGDGLEVAVRQGQANIEGNAGKATLESGDYLDLRDANSPLDPRRLPGLDNWDQWNQERDNIMDGSSQRPSHRYLPSNIAIVANDLDDYGSWRNDPEYGNVWCPRVTSVDWRPYHEGHWTWVSPFGWTWVSDEAWGWAPYHYGTWVSRGYGWAWCPGPVNQYWSPAVVHFSEYDDRVAWCALAPREVRYPSSLSIGFRSGNWSTFFSIGQAAVYYPTYNHYCEARPFRTGYVNHVTYVNNVTNVTNVYNNGSPSFNRYYNSAEFYASNRNTYLQRSQFIPYNARTAAGVTSVATSGFGRRTAYDIVPRANGATVFTSGRTVAAPARGSMPVAGPVAARPTRESLTPTHAFIANPQPAPRAIARPVYQAPLPAIIARRAAPITPSGQVIRQDPVRQMTRTSREGVNVPGTNNREVGRPTISSGNASDSIGRPLPPSFSTGRGNSAGTGSGTYNRNGSGSTNGTVNDGSTGGFNRNPRAGVNAGRIGSGSTNPSSANGSTTSDTGNPRIFRSGESGRTDMGVNSAAEAARRARGTLGLPPNRTSSGSGNSGNNTGNPGSFGIPRSPASGMQDGSARRSGSDTQTYRPNSGSTGSPNTTGTGSNSGSTGRTGNSGGDTRWSTERGRGRGEDTRTYTPQTRTGGDTSPRTYTPPTQTEGDTRSRTYSPPTRTGGYYSPRTYSPPARTGGETAPRTYTPPTRTGGDASPRTYSPPVRSDSGSNPGGYTPRTGSGYSPGTRGSSEGTSHYSPPPTRSREAEPSSRPSSTGRDRSSGSDSSDKTDKDKGGSGRGSRGAR